MKAKFVKLLGLVFASTLTLGVAAGCGGEDTDPDNSGGTAIAAPANIKMSKKGVLTWDKTEGATGYELTIDGKTTALTEAKADLTEIVTTTGDLSAEIKAVKGEEKSEAGTYTFTARKLPTLAKPTVYFDSYTHEYSFKWTGGENVSGYQYSMNGGNWFTETGTERKITSTGEWTIAVRAKAYATGNTLYLAGDSSETSESINYKLGPTLSVPAANNIACTWDAESETYDSFNLWVNGVKYKEDIEFTSGESLNLVMGSNPILTKTGEYDLQVEAIKDGESYWSTMQTEFGTMNINEGEIYSFDNRIKKVTREKDGVAISDANDPKHGETGRSLKVNVNRGEQLNLVKYAPDGHANDIDFTTIKTISMWVYFAPIAGKEASETVPEAALPYVKWETGSDVGGWTSAMYQYKLAEGETVNYGEWKELTIDVYNSYDGVLLIGWNYQSSMADEYVMYIDDISYKALWTAAEAPAGTEYTVKYDYASKYKGNWYNFVNTAIDLGEEYAGKTVTLSMDVCGNALSTAADGDLGIFWKENDVAIVGTTWKYANYSIDTATLSTTSQWKRITDIKVTADENGKVYFAARAWNGGKDVYDIFIKGVTVDSVQVEYDNTGTKATLERVNPSKPWYGAVAALPTDLAAGTEVTVTMDIFVQSDSAYSELGSPTAFYGDDTTSAKNVILESANINTNGWKTVTFGAVVLDKAKIAIINDGVIHDFAQSGKYVAVAFYNAYADDILAYKNVEIKEGKTVTLEQINPNKPWHGAVLALSTNLEANTMVDVTMDVYVSSTSTASLMFSPKSFYGDNTASATETILDNANINTNGYKTVTFSAIVWDQAKIGINNDGVTHDFAQSGKYVAVVFANAYASDTFAYKNVTITSKGTSVAEVKKINGTIHGAVTALHTDLAVGTEVTVTMKVNVTSTSPYSTLRTAGAFWSDNTPNGPTTIYANAEVNTNGWKEITFTSKVINSAQVGLVSNKVITNWSLTGTYVLLYLADGYSGDVLMYKDVVITAKA